MWLQSAKTIFQRQLTRVIALPSLFLLLFSGFSLWQVSRLFSALQWVYYLFTAYTERAFLHLFRLFKHPLTVRLPLVTMQAPNNTDNKQSDHDLNLNGIRILLVDDEVDSQELASFIFAEYGAEVIAVGSGFEAIPHLMSFQPDVLVCDIGMPDMYGYMLLQKIRSLPPEQGGKIPAIALTAYSGKSDKEQAISAGFPAHLPKPVEASQLLEVISKLVKPTL